MRDIKRISQTLEVLQDIWEFYPDLRFNQLIHHLQSQYVIKNNIEVQTYEKVEFVNGWTIKTNVDKFDLFYVEDDKWLEFLIDLKEKMWYN